jgi:hypothetical protein
MPAIEEHHVREQSVSVFSDMTGLNLLIRFSVNRC